MISPLKPRDPENSKSRMSCNLHCSFLLTSVGELTGGTDVLTQKQKVNKAGAGRRVCRASSLLTPCCRSCMERWENLSNLPKHSPVFSGCLFATRRRRYCLVPGRAPTLSPLPRKWRIWWIVIRKMPTESILPCLFAESSRQERARRLYEQGASLRRLRQYVIRWHRWFQGALSGLVSRKGGIKRYWAWVISHLDIPEQDVRLRALAGRWPAREIPTESHVAASMTYVILMIFYHI